MAQGSSKSAFELKQYEKIIRYSDSLLKRHQETNTLFTIDVSRKSSSHKANDQIVKLPNDAPRGQPSAPASALPETSQSRAELNPVCLEKSEDLVKEELKRQRKRLEQSLQVDLEQHRNSKQGPNDQGDELDLSEVLAKALTLVQATANHTHDTETTPANKEATSLSDDDSYYSSRHDTPESQLISRIPDESSIDAANDRRTAGPASVQEEYDPNDVDMDRPKQPSGSYEPPPAATASSPQAQTSRVPGLNNYHPVPSSFHPAQSARSNMNETVGSAAIGFQARPTHLLNHDGVPNPVVRAHNLTPAAPQPTQVPPLAVNMQLAELQQDRDISRIPAAAPVSALRSGPGAATSPESSSHSSRVPEKKKKQKNKRKSDRQAPASKGTFIKTEPRSPSPPNAPAHLRPSKRARHDNAQLVQEPAEAIPRREQHPGAPFSFHGDTSRPSGQQLMFEPPANFPMRSASTALVGDPRYSREMVGGGEAFLRRRVSPGAPVSYYPPRTQDPTRTGSQVLVNDPHTDHRYYRDDREAPRMSVRPDSEYIMQTPQGQPTRILVDASGREFIEPPPPPSVRYSVAPSWHGQPEIVYERPRAISRHPGSYDQAGPVYATPAPGHAVARRVVTQPEYISAGYAEPRYREYSTRPVGPVGDPVPVMPPPDRRHVGDINGNLIPRPSTTRPEPVLYEPFPEYVRVQSVRPYEPPVQDYRRSVRPEALPDPTQGYVREYRQQGPMQEAYGSRPIERYYEQPTMRGGLVGGGGEEVAFIERPRAENREIVYADDGRREMYR